MAEQKHYWVVLSVQPWGALQVTSNLPLAVPVTMSQPTGQDQPMGFLPVFDNKAAAEQWANGDQVFEIATTRRSEG